jgi:hypothetical protein
MLFCARYPKTSGRAVVDAAWLSSLDRQAAYPRDDGQPYL